MEADAGRDSFTGVEANHEPAKGVGPVELVLGRACCGRRSRDKRRPVTSISLGDLSLYFAASGGHHFVCYNTQHATSGTRKWGIRVWGGPHLLTYAPSSLTYLRRLDTARAFAHLGVGTKSGVAVVYYRLGRGQSGIDLFSGVQILLQPAAQGSEHQSPHSATSDDHSTSAARPIQKPSLDGPPM